MIAADAWSSRRNRWLASPRFQRWAAAFPLTRPLATRKARAAFDLCAGFVYSQVLAACVRLRVLERLSAGPGTAEELAKAFALDVSATRRLLDAAAALRLVESRASGAYGLGELGAALLANPGIADLVEHHAVLYGDLADPVSLLRGQTSPRLARYWPYAGTNRPASLTDDEVAGYSRLMSASSSLVTTDILDAYRFARHRRLLDVGGGEGEFLQAVAARAPRLELVLFDLPAVAARARRRLEGTAAAQRATICSGDFHADELPRDVDVVTLIRVLHDHDDQPARRLLAAVHRALVPGGSVVVAEPMSGVRGTGAMGDAYFGMYLWAMRSGRPRTPTEIVTLLAQAGFSAARIVRTRRPLLTSLVVARR